MTGARDLFVSFIVFDSGMYEEHGMRSRHVVYGYGEMVFWMDSGDVLGVTNFPWVPRVYSQSQQLRSRDMQCCSGMDKCYWMLSS
jgi:hypothetical protein